MILGARKVIGYNDILLVSKILDGGGLVGKSTVKGRIRLFKKKR